VQHAALRVHLVDRQAASLGHAEAVPKHQQQQATVAGLVAGAAGRDHQLADLKSGQVAATGLAPPPMRAGHKDLTVIMNRLIPDHGRFVDLSIEGVTRRQ